MRWTYSFMIGTLLLDPAVGATGNTIMSPGSMGIRASLNATGQMGFDASLKIHLARNYKH